VLRAIAEPSDKIFMDRVPTMLGAAMIDNALYREKDFTIKKLREGRLQPAVCPIGFKKRHMKHRMNLPFIRQLELISNIAHSFNNGKRANPLREELGGSGWIM
jgi:hypothetical protein